MSGRMTLSGWPGIFPCGLAGGDVFGDSDGEAEAVPAGEPVYATGNAIRTRRWVWRQAENAMATPESRVIVFPVDGFADSASGLRRRRGSWRCWQRPCSAGMFLTGM